MFEGYRIVCVTPAGRRRYMRLLVPQVLGSALVDRYDIWMNTPDQGDIAFLEGVAKLDPRVRLVAHPEGRKPEIEAIGGFHVTACDPDTIYIRLDDDVVWLEPGFFEALLRFRIDHPHYFMVMPLIINNALCSFQLQILGKITATQYVRATCMDDFGWRDPFLALGLHKLLLELIGKGETARLHIPPREISLNRFSINSLCWFGRDLAQVVDQIGEQEEEDLSVGIPARLGRASCFCGNTIAAHFSFVFQRNKLERSGLLAQYEQVLAARPDLKTLRAQVEEVSRAVDIAHHGSHMPGLYVREKIPMRRKLRKWWRERPWGRQWKPKAFVSAGPKL